MVDYKIRRLNTLIVTCKIITATISDVIPAILKFYKRLGCGIMIFRRPAHRQHRIEPESYKYRHISENPRRRILSRVNFFRLSADLERRAIRQPGRLAASLQRFSDARTVSGKSGFYGVLCAQSRARAESFRALLARFSAAFIRSGDGHEVDGFDAVRCLRRGNRLASQTNGRHGKFSRFIADRRSVGF